MVNFNTKKTLTAITAVCMASTMLMSGCSSDSGKKERHSRQRERNTTTTTTEATTSEETTSVSITMTSSVSRNTLVGNPDLDISFSTSLLRSQNVDNTWINGYSRVTTTHDSYYSLDVKLFYQDGSEDPASYVDVYVFEHNDNYIWDTTDALAECTAYLLADEEMYYWAQFDMYNLVPSESYTLVAVRPDGTVDSMFDFELDYLGNTSNTVTPVEYETLIGNPDLSSADEYGLCRSLDIEESWIDEVYTMYCKSNWVMYTPILSGSELTVELLSNGSADIGDRVTVYIFEHNDDYVWNTEDAYASFEGELCNTVNGQLYYCDTILPDTFETGTYTLVVVRPDGTVDSCMDFDMIATPEEATTVSELD